MHGWVANENFFFLLGNTSGGWRFYHSTQLYITFIQDTSAMKSGGGQTILYVPHFKRFPVPTSLFPDDVLYSSF